MTLSQTMRYGCLILFLTGLGACNDATATPKLQDVPETKPVTRAECLAMTVKEDKIACFKILANQREAELEASQKRIEVLKAENDKRRERNEALLKEFEKGVLDED